MIQMLEIPQLTKTERIKFWSGVKISTPDKCWNWLKARDHSGYGKFEVQGRRVMAHRVMFILTGRAMPKGTVTDHLCRNTSCVNPNHLEAVSPRENALRGTGPSAKHARQTACKNGHPFSGWNLYIHPTTKQRICKRCRYTNRVRVLFAKDAEHRWRMNRLATSVEEQCLSQHQIGGVSYRCEKVIGHTGNHWKPSVQPSIPRWPKNSKQSTPGER